MTHVYRDSSALYTIAATATDEDGTYNSNSATVAVSNQSPSAAITGISTPRREGTPIAVTGAATDPAGSFDTLTYSWAVFKGSAPTAFAATSGVYVTAFSFTPDDNGNYTIRLTVSDEDGSESRSGNAVFTPAPLTGQPVATWQQGGGGYILIGGDGDDLVVGGAGRDLLIGGYGKEHLSHTIADAISRGCTSRGTPHDDAIADILTSSERRDRFDFHADDELGSVKDKANGLSAKELANDIDFLVDS